MHRPLGNPLPALVLAAALACGGCSKNNPSEPSGNSAVATITMDNSRQTIRGFGGVNMPGWIADMTPDQVTKAFGAGPDQIGMTILRLRVPYEDSLFSLELPAAQLAKSMGAIIIASPWTPPPSMKTNQNIVGGSLADSAYGSFAAHLKAFADYMAANGAALEAVSIQNEPDVSVTYESCDWTAAQMVKFIKSNAPGIGVRIIAPESFNFDRTISDAILNDPAAASAVSIIGGHIYGSAPASYPLALNKGKEVWMTEHLVLDTIWSMALSTGKEIHDCMVEDMSAYLWWYIRRFYGPIDDNSNVTRRGYVMSQFARFIRPGYVRVDATEHPQDYVYVSAYRNGTRLVIVALNQSAAALDQEFTIQGGTPARFTRYSSSRYVNCAQGADIAVAGGTFTASLEKQSITTFVSD